MTESHLEPEVDDLPEQMQVRRAKRERMLDAGMAPYPLTFARTATLAEIRSEFAHLQADETSGVTHSVSGRVIFVRNTGKLCFATIRDGEGIELQIMLSLDKVGEESLAEWKSLVDIGDFVGVTGEVISSRRGELSVLTGQWQMVSKALRPLPVAHKPLNEETRVRQRYVDLIVRPEARQMARMRPLTLNSLRETFADAGYIEVETPMLQTLHGGAAARPFATHSNAFDMQLFLRIAPELFLKRCVVGGLERVFEINRNFRNEGADSTHSPEFAMLEFYQSYADYNDMAEFTKRLIQNAALAVHGTLQVTHFDGSVHDLGGDWASISMFPAVSEALGEEISPETPIERLVELAKASDIKPEKTWVHGKFVEELFEHHVSQTFSGPTFVRDFPVDTSPLVRDHRSIRGVVEKWDLYVDGFELATGYSELIDPVIQRERLVAQSALGAQGDVEAMRLDEDFLRALEYGAPPMGGVGLGVDRLLMALSGLGIRETILFPLVKPERS
jgi:lysyl-tRNA synthetase class 2